MSNLNAFFSTEPNSQYTHQHYVRANVNGMSITHLATSTIPGWTASPQLVAVPCFAARNIKHDAKLIAA